MKTSFDHFPAAKQREHEHVKTVLMREFETAIAGGTQPWRRNGSRESSLSLMIRTVIPNTSRAVLGECHSKLAEG
jgi:hypothetical protein